MYEFFLSLMLVSSWLFLKTLTPLFTSILLVVFTLSGSLFLLNQHMAWMFMAVTIMFLGGMMVVFIYASSLSTSKKAWVKFEMKKFLLFFTILLFTLKIFKRTAFFNCSMAPSMIFSENTKAVLMVMAFYLLLALLILVKMIRWSDGPLKS